MDVGSHDWIREWFYVTYLIRPSLDWGSTPTGFVLPFAPLESNPLFSQHHETQIPRCNDHRSFSYDHCSRKKLRACVTEIRLTSAEYSVPLPLLPECSAAHAVNYMVLTVQIRVMNCSVQLLFYWK